MNENIKAELYSLWSIQDALLQSYRGVFITAQSIVMSLAAAIAVSEHACAVLPLFILGAVLMYAWLSVTLYRGNAVSFSQQLIQWAEEGRNVENPFKTFKSFQATPRKTEFTVNFTDKTKCGYQTKSFWNGKTRVRMEFIVPLGFGLCWVLILLYVYGIF